MSLEDWIGSKVPSYLFPADKHQLLSEIRSFRTNSNYFTSLSLGVELLQGDAWEGFELLDFTTGNRKVVKGVILSNTCDISAENSRDVVPNVLFAPLVDLSKYVKILQTAGKSEESTKSLVESLRRQEVTSAFYVPGTGELAESIVILDQISSHPVTHFLETTRRRLFRLGQFGHYLFLIKLSIHFCRFQEGVNRYGTVASNTV